MGAAFNAAAWTGHFNLGQLTGRLRDGYGYAFRITGTPSDPNIQITAHLEQLGESVEPWTPAGELRGLLAHVIAPIWVGTLYLPKREGLLAFVRWRMDLIWPEPLDGAVLLLGNRAGVLNRREFGSMIRYHRNLVQGSDEWLAARCGMLTASEMKLILTPNLKIAANEKERAHLYELLAQRVTGYVEPAFVSDDMLRGQEDEVEARILYAENFAPVEEVGFITNDWLGFQIGFSPDGLVGDDGLIECKSRRQKFQVETVIEAASGGIAPAEVHAPDSDGVDGVRAGMVRLRQL